MNYCMQMVPNELHPMGTEPIRAHMLCQNYADSWRSFLFGPAADACENCKWILNKMSEDLRPYAFAE